MLPVGFRALHGPRSRCNLEPETGSSGRDQNCGDDWDQKFVEPYFRAVGRSKVLEEAPLQLTLDDGGEGRRVGPDAQLC